jgi:cbb3-type cytochrome oxidase maturation protein
MDILYLLVPMSVLLALGILLVFAWALRSGQFDDVDAEGQRILDDDQGANPGPSEESSPSLEDSNASNDSNKNRRGPGRL